MHALILLPENNLQNPNIKTKISWISASNYHYPKRQKFIKAEQIIFDQILG